MSARTGKPEREESAPFPLALGADPPVAWPASLARLRVTAADGQGTPAEAITGGHGVCDALAAAGGLPALERFELLRM